MKKLNNRVGFIKQSTTVILVYISRFGMLPPNISPLGSFGFFGQNIFLYFLTIILFDFLKGGFYSGFLFTYLGFFSYWFFGKIAKTQKRQFFLLPLASFTFFLISNLGVWWYWYPHTVSELLTCYILAVPFYKNTLIGDLFFGYGFLSFKILVKFVANRKIENRLNSKVLTSIQ
ncbi:hypothetical protein KKD03_01845 [Patescibacteria group bacterium]|nr:hypothetical protein [Patescibacteria group bacterium]